jgi:hypothetical protein
MSLRATIPETTLHPFQECSPTGWNPLTTMNPFLIFSIILYLFIATSRKKRNRPGGRDRVANAGEFHDQEDGDNVKNNITN